MTTTLAALKLILVGSANTLTGVSISNADPSVLTKLTDAASIDDALSVGDVVTVNSGTNATTGKYIAESIVKNVSVTLDRQAATGACTDGNITYPSAQGILQDSSYTSAIATNINAAVREIAAGIRMSNTQGIPNQTSPPLPDLLATGTVETATDAAYKALPSNYQRHVFMVVDEVNEQLYPPKGGGYYDFAMFLKRASKKDLTQTGSISMVCVKGSNLYYQGIPSAAYDLIVHYYRKPVDMVDDSDTVDGLPDHLTLNLIKHYVAKEIYGEGLEDDEVRKVGMAYHTGKFNETMLDLIDWAGIDAVPEYYSGTSAIDLGVCD